MEHTAFINIDQLDGEARKELETFYEFLLFKHRKKEVKKPQALHGRFAEFLSNTIKTEQFELFNREERNER